MGAKKQTIGYNYLFSIHMGIGRGPVNEIAEIRVGDVTLIDTPICIAEGGQLVTLNKPDLFGGEQKEGGIKGPMYVYNGARDQVLQPALNSNVGKLPAIADMLGGDVPNFRGVVSIWYDGLVCSLNPYPKEWSFRIRRSTAGWWNESPWYPAKATIVLESNGKPIFAMNPAHMLYEINTNPEWGRGMPPEVINENSYINAANQLCDERFGLCIPWFRQEGIKDFIPVIINHIGAVQYIDRSTGQLTLRLIRADYVEADLPLYTPDTGLLAIEDDDASGEDTAYNEIIVKGFDPTTKEAIALRYHNLASIDALGEIISNTVEYNGLPTRDLVARVAQREAMLQLPLRRMTLTMDRRAWRIAPGMPFKISHPGKGIANMVVRAGEITDGTLINGQVQIKVVQDVFAMPSTTYIQPTDPIWTPPNMQAVASPESRLLEANYRDYYRRSEAADREALSVGTSIVGMVAKAPPNVSNQGYDIATKVSLEDDYETFFNGGFTAWLTLKDSLLPLDAEMTVEEANIDAFMLEFQPGMVAQIDDEQLQIETFDPDTGIAAVRRGVADTLPQNHMAGETIWLVDDEIVSDGKEYEDGETVYGKALTRTSTDLLDIYEAEESSVQVDQRVMRPYPPGNLKVDGVSVYLVNGEHPEPVLTWAHRDRIVQADQAIGHGEGSVGPEVGTTYTIRVFDLVDDAYALREDTGIVGDNWTYTADMQYEDGNPLAVWIEIESVRDELVSHFYYRFVLTIADVLTVDYDILLIDGEPLEF